MPASSALGPLEMQVLGLLDRENPLTVAAVQAKLRTAGSALAYTTVMTVLARLHQKGFADRFKDGQRYTYVPSRTARHVGARLLTQIQRSLFQSDRARPILALLDDQDLSRDELRALRKVIDARLKAGKA